MISREKKNKSKTCVLPNKIRQIPFPQWAEAYFHGGFVIRSQVTLIRETHHDPTHVLGGRTALLHSFQQGSVSAPLEIRSLGSKAALSSFRSSLASCSPPEPQTLHNGATHHFGAICFVLEEADPVARLGSVVFQNHLLDDRRPKVNWTEPQAGHGSLLRGDIKEKADWFWHVPVDFAVQRDISHCPTCRSKISRRWSSTSALMLRVMGVEFWSMTLGQKMGEVKIYQICSKYD